MPELSKEAGGLPDKTIQLRRTGNLLGYLSVACLLLGYFSFGLMPEMRCKYA
jgi:hypothetical protein